MPTFPLFPASLHYKNNCQGVNRQRMFCVDSNKNIKHQKPTKGSRQAKKKKE